MITRKFFLLDQETLTREAVHRLLRDQHATVIGDAADPQLLGDLDRPIPWNFLILELGHPASAGLKVLRDVKRKLPKCKVMVFSFHLDPETVLEAMASA